MDLPPTGNGRRVFGENILLILKLTKMKNVIIVIAISYFADNASVNSQTKKMMKAIKKAEKSEYAVKGRTIVIKV